MLLVLSGFILMVLEFFVPSAGSLGGLAAICLIAAIVLAYSISAAAGTLVLFLVLVGVPLVLAGMIKVWPYTPIGRRLFLNPSALPDDPVESDLKQYVGRVGVATTPMLPAGMIRIERATFDAVAEGEAVEKGEKVVVKGVRMKRLIIRKLDPMSVMPESPSTTSDVEKEMLDRPIDEFGLESWDESPASDLDDKHS
jgi:membrane-bound serine protease (ClpP class)